MLIEIVIKKYWKFSKLLLKNPLFCTQIKKKNVMEEQHNMACQFKRNIKNISNAEIKLTLSRERERNVLFNDTLNTFYLRLYGVRHMVKDHSDSEKGNPLSPHRLLLSINSKSSSICTILQTG